MLRRLFRVPWTVGRSNQSILNEINPEYSLEGLVLKLKLQYFDHLMWRANSLEKPLGLEKVEGRRRRGQQRTRCMDGITDSMDNSLSKLWEIVKFREAWCAAAHGITKSCIWLSNWTTKIFRDWERVKVGDLGEIYIGGTIGVQVQIVRIDSACQASGACFTFRW